MRILILGDVIGQPGLRAVVSALKGLIRTHRADVVIVNGENSDEGFGINPVIADQLFKAGADVITTGNHVWHHDDIAELLNSNPRILRPDNYPGGAPGNGHYVHEGKAGRLAVINLQGRDRMIAIDCPFRRSREIIKRLDGQVDAIVVDFHAESTEEKEALSHYLDGDVTVLYGTHTHVQTADERILSGGTAVITDIGACGPDQSVIGFDPAISVRRVITQLPLKNEVASNAATLHGLVVQTEDHGLRATAVERFQFRSLI
ncbi:MAG: TIGR00282 family metallophosphoesterase [Alkalispirochaeta sp.]